MTELCEYCGDWHCKVCGDPMGQVPHGFVICRRRKWGQRVRLWLRKLLATKELG